MANLTKTELRAQIIEKRKQLSTAEAEAAAEAVATTITTLIAPGSWVAGYSPIRGELDIVPALKKLYYRGVKLALPKVLPQAEMVFLAWTPDDKMSEDRHKIPSPQYHVYAKPNIWIVPLVGFDKDRQRLGYGSGYYDRAIAEHKPKQTIGVAYSFQEVDKLPVEAHDMPLDMIITERGKL